MKTSALLLLAATLAFALNAAPTGSMKFSGKVVDAEGKPVADAAVDCYSYPNRMAAGLPELEAKQHATTDANGQFEFSVSEGAFTVVAKKPGLATGWRTWETAPKGSAGPVVLTSPSELAGVVVDENGKPVAGADVSVSMALAQSADEDAMQRNVLFGEAASGAFSAHTSVDGHFRIANFPVGAQANFSVKAAGRALQASSARMQGGQGMQLQARAGQEDIKLVMEAAGTIEGTLVVRDSGTPLPGTRIQLQPVNQGNGFSMPPGPVYTGANGEFRITGLAAGSYRVTAVFTNQPLPLWASESVPVTVKAGETARDVKVQAFKGGVVQVTVIGKDNSKGLPGVNVSAYNMEQGYPASGTSGSNGVVWFRLPPGQFTIFAMRQGSSQAQTQSSVADGETNRVRLELNPASKIAGMVRDSAGAPVAGTTVLVVPNYGNDGSAVADDNGHYEVTWQKPTWAGAQDQRFYVVARNSERKLAGMHEIDESAASLDLDLKPAMSISAQVQDAKGKPIPNANVFVMIQMQNMTTTIGRQGAHADQDGRIRVEALPMGESYSLSVSAAGYGSVQKSMESSVKSDHYDFPPITLKLADRKLAGRVLGQDGKPVVGANVWIHGDGQPNGNATTDDNGRFTFDAVCEGPISLSASTKGQGTSAEARGGDTNVTIRFNANNYAYNQVGSLTVSGTVYDSSGRPASGIHVAVTPAWGPDNSTTTDDKGGYTLHWQNQPGMRGARYFVLARDTRRNEAGMEEINEKKTEASVHMEAGISIAGTVQDIDGNPLPRANINLNVMVGNMGGMVTHEPIVLDSDGSFTIPALPKGQQYFVNASAMDHGSSSKNISKNQSQSNSVTLPPFKLKIADKELAGQVVGTDGKPLAGAQVYTYGNNQPNANTRTDEDGHFKLKVCSGPIYVNAFVPSGGQPNYANVQARGGDVNLIVKMGSQMQGRARRVVALTPRPWTLDALISWPLRHRPAAVVLLGAQAAVLLAAGVTVLVIVTRRKP